MKRTAVLEALESGMTEPAEAELDEGEVEATDAPVIQLVNLIVHDAIRNAGKRYSH